MLNVGMQFVCACRVIARIDSRIELSNTVKDIAKLSLGAFFLSHWVSALHHGIIGLAARVSSLPRPQLYTFCVLKWVE